MTKYVYADPKKGIPDWLPGVERVNGNGSGSVLPGSKWSLLLHTTEGPTIEGAISALRSANAWSHFIFDPVKNRLIQAVPMNQAARSLRSGGNFGKTNAARVIQVEIVGRAHEAPFWSAEVNKNIGNMIRRIANVVPFDVSMPVQFYGDRSGFTVASESARQRMSWFNWYRFDAICGHQHAPKNSHWDPGEIQVGQILAAARQGSVAPKPPAWVAPKFPGYTLKEGQRSNDVAVLKLLLTAAGYGKGLDLSEKGVKTYGAGTSKAVKRALVAFYNNQKKDVPKTLDGKSVGPITWKWICDVVTVKKAQEK